MLKIFLFVMFSILTIEAQNRVSLSMNDVSVLFPLPKAAEWNLLPHGSQEGTNGTLLPLVDIQRIPWLIENVPNDKIYASLYAVGFRIDPCFTEGAAPVKCKQQIRFIWQPLLQAGEETSTADAALHSFYELSEEQFKTLVSELRELKAGLNTPDPSSATLGINPQLKSLGLRSTYYNKMLSIIFQYIGKKNLSRITFMQIRMGEKNWNFGGFDFIENKMVKITIPRTGGFEQQFTNMAGPRPLWFQGGIFPEPRSPENLNIITRSSRDLTRNDETAIIEAARSAFKFENPKLHNPGTLDCVSCHVAQPAKIWALRQYPWLDLDNLSRDSIYTNANFNLRNMSPMQPHTNIVRAFGYFMNMPFVAQRTINESAEVADYIKQNY